MLTHPLVVQVRVMTRRIGLNRLIGRWLSRGPYEDRFARAFNEAIRAGDTVWDVGANLGLYTGSLLQAAGPSVCRSRVWLAWDRGADGGGLPVDAQKWAAAGLRSGVLNARAS